MTQYYVNISPELLPELLRSDNLLPSGFRLIRCTSRNPITELDRWLVEDRDAPVTMEGKLVDIIWERRLSESKARIQSRCVIGTTNP